MKIAYFDLVSGISGDMCLGALLDLGVPVEWLRERLADLPLSDFSLSSKVSGRKGIHGTRALVEAREGKVSRDHADIRALLENADMSLASREKSLGVFERLARAEAKIHKSDPDHVHLHEVGGIDAIVDVAGTVLCLEYLGVGRVLASPIPLGRGFVQCAHGTLPVPAPATLELIRGCPTYGTGIEAELVTPTGAALLTTLAEGFGPIPAMRPEAVGYGMGGRDLAERPNCLRVVLGEESGTVFSDRVAVVSTNLDDMNPELFENARDGLFADGALDVAVFPVQMKKGRPGAALEVICPPGLVGRMAERILSQTTALGVRVREEERRILFRESVAVETALGVLRAKRAVLPDGNIRMYAEYEECLRVSTEKNIPLLEVYRAVERADPGREQRPGLDKNQGQL